MPQSVQSLRHPIQIERYLHTIEQSITVFASRASKSLKPNEMLLNFYMAQPISHTPIYLSNGQTIHFYK